MLKYYFYLFFVLSLISCTQQGGAVDKEHHANTSAHAASDNEQTMPNDGIPKKALKVLDYIKANGSAPDGYVGGKRFGNYEKLLPKSDDNGRRIQYKEWDVNPKQKGKNRGAERLVTGSDGSAYYTDDHYKSFTEIK